MYVIECRVLIRAGPTCLCHDKYGWRKRGLELEKVEGIRECFW